MRKPNYDRFPATKVDGTLCQGWDLIVSHLADAISLNGGKVLAIDCYTGVYEDEIISAFSPVFSQIVQSAECMKPQEEIQALTAPFMTDDPLFGYSTSLRIKDFFDEKALTEVRNKLAKTQELTLVIGPGAHLIAPDALLVYADMARWEIQQRFRRHEVCGLGIDNREDPVSVQYKRGLFIDWKVLDLYKDKIFGDVSFWLDTNAKDKPKMIDAQTFMQGIDATVASPFRVVPFFDPAPWGGQWMKEVCDLDKSKSNYGWCFDCVPEENSLLFEVDGVLFELPANDLVLLRSRKLLGETVEARFGKDFPIRFDLLDTFDGGNLSLQVHPTAQFIREEFGLPYTQDESYYILDAKEGAHVYLGVKEGVDPQDMLGDLRAAQRGEIAQFDAEKYVNRLPAKKHDHFLIPGGTIHCSGANCLVLEISATPNIFTFKLWDWGRLGLDGKPRPINIERGSKVIDWGRKTGYVKANLANNFSDISSGDGWKEIHTGLHPNEFIESRRMHFIVPVTQNTNGGVQVLNLVEGEEITVESPTEAFKPFHVHYAETFIIPACIGEYILRPIIPSESGECAVIRAYVRNKA